MFSVNFKNVSVLVGNLHLIFQKAAHPVKPSCTLVLPPVSLSYGESASLVDWCAWSKLECSSQRIRLYFFTAVGNLDSTVVGKLNYQRFIQAWAAHRRAISQAGIFKSQKLTQNPKPPRKLESYCRRELKHLSPKTETNCHGRKGAWKMNTQRGRRQLDKGVTDGSKISQLERKPKGGKMQKQRPQNYTKQSLQWLQV